MQTAKKPVRRRRPIGELTKAQAKRLPVIDLTHEMEEAVILEARKFAERFKVVPVFGKKVNDPWWMHAWKFGSYK